MEFLFLDLYFFFVWFAVWQCGQTTGPGHLVRDTLKSTGNLGSIDSCQQMKESKDYIGIMGKVNDGGFSKRQY